VVAVPASAITEEVVGEEELQQAPPPRKRKADPSMNHSGPREKVSKRGAIITRMGVIILCLWIFSQSTIDQPMLDTSSPQKSKVRHFK